MDKNPIFVTGATGFIGRHLIPLLIKAGYPVTIITRDRDNLTPFEWKDRVTAIEHDMNQPHINFNIPQKSSLINLAWEGLPNYKDLFHFERNLPAQYRFIKTLVERGVTHVLNTGTCFEYGMKSGAIDAYDPTDPQNPYAIAKDSLRRFLTSLQSQNDFTLQWARLFYMYGEGQNPKSILAQLDTAIDNGDSVFNMSGGEQLRDYMPVTDVARDLFDLYESGKGGCFNICSGQPVSIRTLVERRIAEKSSPITMNLGYYPYPDYEPMAFWGKKGND